MRILRGLSIRWRLAALSAGLTFLVLCAFATVIGQLTASRIRSDFNNQMAAAVDDLRDRLVVDVVGGRIRVRTGLETYAASNGAVVRVLAQKNGAIIKQTRNAPNFGLAGVAVGRTDQVGGYRVESRTSVLTDQSGALRLPVVVQYARKVSVVEDTVHNVRLFLLLGVLAGTGLALVGGLAVSRRALAPIARLTSTARDIGRTRDPSRRVPQPDTEDEVGELARTLDEMLRALEGSRAETAAALERQRQFVADASHELRTPLTSVLANLELLAEVLDGEQGETARSALRSTRRMRRLVGDLLLLARADAERETPHKPLDVSQVVVEAAAELGPIAADHELEVDAPAPAMVDGARDELHRLFLNLMENAIKHTPPGTHVRASVRQAGEQVTIAVEDDGPGVPENLRDRIFERFVRGEGDRGGSFGLGLSIVRAVAESHGGTVALEGASRFVVCLPAVEVREPVAA
ncbi:MAG: HAMP domain-containing histidine kinase [Solirubrobacterales bacterium]|nr:HAMP domain-containing histidine kinase [Solirubrobacterales bacterium]